MHPIDIAKAAVRPIYHYTRTRAPSQQPLRLTLSNAGKPSLAERGRSEISWHLLAHEPVRELVIEVMPNQENLMSRRSQIFRQRQIGAIHPPVLVKPSAHDHPRLPLSRAGARPRLWKRADWFWNLGWWADHNQSFFLSAGALVNA
jgi:hypothetical protein